jgi:hypothetical protein
VDTDEEIIAAVVAEVARLQQSCNHIAGLSVPKRRGRPAGKVGSKVESCRRSCELGWQRLPVERITHIQG